MSSPAEFVGLNKTTQSVLGASKPVVRTFTFARNFNCGFGVPKRSAGTNSPLNRVRISARSPGLVSPVTIAHSLPEKAVIFSATCLQWSTDVQKIRTDFRSRVRSTISRQAAVTRSSLSIATSTSALINSPPRMCRSSSFATVLPDFEIKGER